MIDGWCEIQNAGEDYLMLKKTTQTIVTRLKNKNTKTYKAMYTWCQENCEGSWGPGCLPEYDYYITWRFWRELFRVLLFLSVRTFQCRPRSFEQALLHRWWSSLRKPALARNPRK